jgi:hypothetical protein
MNYHHQYFSAGLPLDFRKPVGCRADELDLLLEAARAAGHGLTKIETRHGLFRVTFQPVEAYHNQPNKTEPCN